MNDDNIDKFINDNIDKFITEYVGQCRKELIQRLDENFINYQDKFPLGTSFITGTPRIRKEIIPDIFNIDTLRVALSDNSFILNRKDFRKTQLFEQTVSVMKKIKSEMC